MAHMSDTGGPYPDKAGEYCGNHKPGSPVPRMFDESPADAAKHQREWLAKMCFGRPRPSDTYTTKQLEAMEMVGLYLKEDQSLFSWESPCPTPLELLEPGSERAIIADLINACQELTPILRERLHWRLLVLGERKLILRIEAAVDDYCRQHCRARETQERI